MRHFAGKAAYSVSAYSTASDGRRFERDEPDSDWMFELPRPLNWIATLSFWFWALGCLVMLTVLLALCP